MNTDRNRNRKVKVRMLTVDANCLGCGDGGKAVIYYNPDEETYKRVVLPGKWEDLTNELPYCPRCRGEFVSKFTESDTKWYTSKTSEVSCS